MSFSESDVLNTICTYLHSMGYFFFRVNNTGVYDPVRKVHRSMPRWGMKGVSDIIVVHRGEVYFIEVKKPKTDKSAKTYQSPDQKAFQAMVESNDGNYHVVRSYEDIKAVFPFRA